MRCSSATMWSHSCSARRWLRPPCCRRSSWWRRMRRGSRPVSAPPAHPTCAPALLRLPQIRLLDELDQVAAVVAHEDVGWLHDAPDEHDIDALGAQFALGRIHALDAKAHMLVAVGLQIAVRNAALLGQRLAVLDLEQLHAQRAAPDHRHLGVRLGNLEPMLHLEPQHLAVPAYRGLEVRDADATVMKSEFDRHAENCRTAVAGACHLSANQQALQSLRRGNKFVPSTR